MDRMKKGKNKKLKKREAQFIVVLNALLTLVCVILAVICYIKDLNGYGVFMIGFACFFMAWGVKFKKAKTE
ncbi:MAG: hypothetical protein KIB49_02100 [Clostridiales bacterium]|nr:hypothetical protein [Clostridiales bacterium]